MYCKLFQCLGTCIFSKEFKSLLAKLDAEAEKYCHTVHNFKINGQELNHSTYPFYIFIINIINWIKLIISSPYIQSVDIHLYKSIIMCRWRNCKLYKSPSPLHLPPLSLSLAQCYEKKCSSTHFVQMFNWISHNEKCIANYFSVWVLVFLVNTSSPWPVTYKTECRSRKTLPYIT